MKKLRKLIFEIINEDISKYSSIYRIFMLTTIMMTIISLTMIDASTSVALQELIKE